MTSAIYEVLAWNGLAAALMEDFGALEPHDRNLARRAFLRPGDARSPLYGVSDGAEFRRHVVRELRLSLAKYPSDPTVINLVDDLRAGSGEFDELWEGRDVQTEPMLTKTFHHPVVGYVTVDCDATVLTDRDQRLVLYSAPTGSPAAESLSFLSVLGNEGIRTTKSH